MWEVGGADDDDGRMRPMAGSDEDSKSSVHGNGRRNRLGPFIIQSVVDVAVSVQVVGQDKAQAVATLDW